jgi:aryl sulfotransferase
MTLAVRLRPQDHRSSPQPSERRVYRNGIVDSGNWDNLPLRARDIVICTTTPGAGGRTQDILLRLARRGRPGQAISPWVDEAGVDVAAMAKMLETIPHRRVLTSHLPLDGLPFREDVTYVAVFGDPRDTLISLRDGEADLPVHAKTAFNDWLASNPFHHVSNWWQHRRLQNVHFVHASDLLNDSVTEIAALAEHIGLGLHLSQARAIATETAFSANCRHAHGEPGRADRWKGALSEEELQRYEAAKQRTLDPACASYLERGRCALW